MSMLSPCWIIYWFI